MTTGEKIAALRRQNHYTQEQLAQLLGVSRQSVSKYESNLAYPETEKLIRLSNLFGCTVDDLLNDLPETSFEHRNPSVQPAQERETVRLSFALPLREKKSDRMLWGLPLWHIGKNARGVIAIGFKATGILSIGFLSMGVVSFGFVSLGLLAFGLLAVGLLAAGTFALGIVAAGAVCAGIVAVGAVAVGHFAMGAAAVGRYFAVGDYAQAMFAAGKTTVNGSVMGFLKGQSPQDLKAVMESMRLHWPGIYHWLIPLWCGLL